MKPSKQANKQTEVIEDIKPEEGTERFQRTSEVWIFFFLWEGLEKNSFISDKGSG